MTRRRFGDAEKEYLNLDSADILLVELDGCMLPTGEFKTAREAGRTNLAPDKIVRIDLWIEARTGFARGIDEVEKLYVCQNATYDVICEQLFCHGMHKKPGS